MYDDPTYLTCRQSFPTKNLPTEFTDKKFTDKKFTDKKFTDKKFTNRRVRQINEQTVMQFRRIL